MSGSINNSTGVLDALRYLQTSTEDLGSRQHASVVRPPGVAGARRRHGLSFRLADEGAVRIAERRDAEPQPRQNRSPTPAINAGEQVSKLMVNMADTVGKAASNDLSPDQRRAYDGPVRLAADPARHISSAAPRSTIPTSSTARNRWASASSTPRLSRRATLSASGTQLPCRAEIIVTLIPTACTTSHRPPTPSGDQSRASRGSRSRASATSSPGNWPPSASASRPRKGFVGKLADALADGVGAWSIPMSAVESALIQALQVKQELSGPVRRHRQHDAAGPAVAVPIGQC